MWITRRANAASAPQSAPLRSQGRAQHLTKLCPPPLQAQLHTAPLVTPAGEHPRFLCNARASFTTASARLRASDAAGDPGGGEASKAGHPKGGLAPPLCPTLTYRCSTLPGGGSRFRVIVAWRGEGAALRAVGAAVEGESQVSLRVSRWYSRTGRDGMGWTRRQGTGRDRTRGDIMG